MTVTPLLISGMALYILQKFDDKKPMRFQYKLHISKAEGFEQTKQDCSADVPSAAVISTGRSHGVADGLGLQQSLCDSQQADFSIVTSHMVIGTANGYRTKVKLHIYNR